jgi:hypothetical protein
MLGLTTNLGSAMGSSAGMQRHEVPTVFVHGHAAPADVREVEEHLWVALLRAPALQYSVLWIETSTVEIRVEVEAGLRSGVINARGDGATVGAAGDNCIRRLMEQFSAVLVQNGT